MAEAAMAVVEDTMAAAATIHQGCIMEVEDITESIITWATVATITATGIIMATGTATGSGGAMVFGMLTATGSRAAALPFIMKAHNPSIISSSSL